VPWVVQRFDWPHPARGSIYLRAGVDLPVLFVAKRFHARARVAYWLSQRSPPALCTDKRSREREGRWLVGGRKLTRYHTTALCTAHFLALLQVCATSPKALIAALVPNEAEQRVARSEDSPSRGNVNKKEGCYRTPSPKPADGVGHSVHPNALLFVSCFLFLVVMCVSICISARHLEVIRMLVG
jgi:hypothetical protein